jgi:hypothetical protein
MLNECCVEKLIDSAKIENKSFRGSRYAMQNVVLNGTPCKVLKDD